MKQILNFTLLFCLIQAAPGAELAEVRAQAERNDAVAQKDLGIMYANGTGVPKDYHEAVKWLRLAADQGNAAAQKNLGLMYANGTGVARDSTEAVKWFRKAAAQGYPKALFRMGAAYETGAGVPQDRAEAIIWYRQAAIRAEPATLAYLAEMYTKGTGGVPVDFVHAAAWLRIAESRGHVDAPMRRASLEREMSDVSKADAAKLAREILDKTP
jgi:TPR repeat protein